MPDEDTQTDVGQTDGGQVDGGQTTDDKVDITKQSDGEFMADTVDKIKDTQKAILNEGDENASSTNDNLDNSSNSDNAIAELAGHDIPDVFSDAAEAAGMSSSDIIAFADEHTDEQLIEMIPTLESALEESDDKQDDDKVAEQDDKTDKDVGSKDVDQKLEAKIADRIAKQLEEKFGTSLKEIEEFKANQEKQSVKQMAETASKLFDTASKESPVFGKTEELPRFPSGRLAGQLIPTSSAMKARLEVLRFADAFMGKGADIDNAMANALATYKGLHLEKESQRKAIRDLKNHETSLSGARIGKETKKKHADSRSEIIDDIRQMQRNAGID
jgi:hypothetical protein